MSIAFFDVDETVINSKSMFQFLAFICGKYPWLFTDSYSIMMENIRLMAQDGASREQVNSYYYRLFKGVSQNLVRDVAKTLFDSGAIEYNLKVTERIKIHQDNGDDVVFISGSMDDIIFPIMQALKVSHSLCSLPEVKTGAYTGNLLRQSIGKGKAIHAIEYAQEQKMDLVDCYAYGDHISDLALLECVGKPCAVNPSAALNSIAVVRGWERLQ